MSKIRVNSDLMYGDVNLKGSIVDSRLNKFSEIHPLTGGDIPVDMVLVKPEGMDWGYVPSSDIRYEIVEGKAEEKKSESIDFGKLKKELVDTAKKAEKKTKDFVKKSTTGTLVGASIGAVVALSNKSGVMGFIGWSVVGGIIGNIAGRQIEKQKI